MFTFFYIKIHKILRLKTFTLIKVYDIIFHRKNLRGEVIESNIKCRNTKEEK